MEANRCPGCMKLKKQSPVCEHCGFDERETNASHQLPIGTVLKEQYLIGRVLGQGGFGITYIGWDLNLELPLAIKEYYPNGLVARDCTHSLEVASSGYASETFQHNRERFLREARAMAKLYNIPGIVKIYNYFPENNTAYITMEYVQGEDLKDYIRCKDRPLTPAETFAVLRPVMDALSTVHAAGLVHRDISPDNIMIQPDGSAKLLDFGAVREVKDADVAKNLSRSTESILKHGYAPIEQYQRRGNLGPWTDVYALCATVYYCLTREVPPDAPERMIEEAPLEWEKIAGLTEKQMQVFTHGMALLPKDRIISVAELRQELFPPEPVAEPKPAQEIERKIETEVVPEQITVPVAEPEAPEIQRPASLWEQRDAAPTVMMLTPPSPEELQKQRREAELQEQARLQQLRLEQWKQEQLRQEQEKQERHRLAREQKERERLEQERLEAQRQEQLRVERERREAEKREQLRLAREQKERQRLEQERLEKERQEKLHQERQRREAEKQEKRRLEQERREAEQRRRREVQKRQEEEKQQRREAQLERSRQRQAQKQAEAETQPRSVAQPRKKRSPNAILTALALLVILGTAIFLLKPKEEAILQEPVGETMAVETMEDGTVAETLSSDSNANKCLSWHYLENVKSESYTYAPKLEQNTLTIESENLSITVENNRTVTVTVSGLDIQSSYLTNLPTSYANSLEYLWSVVFIGDETISINTWDSCREPGANIKHSLNEMHHQLREGYNETWLSDGVKLQNWDDHSITWSCVIPTELSFDFSTLKQVAVHVEDFTKDTALCRTYDLKTEDPVNSAAEGFGNTCEICTPNAGRDQTEFTYQAEYNGDQLVILSENLYVKVVDNKNITVTVSGLDIANSYPVNLLGSSKNALEYGWEIYFVADKNCSISTASWAFHPGENGVKTASGMQHTLWMEDGDSYNNAASAQMTSTSDSITWTCWVPWNYSIDFSKLEQIAVHVTNIPENIRTCRVYNPASGTTEKTPSEEAPSAYSPAKNPTYSPSAWKSNMLMRNALDACKGLLKAEIQSVIVLDTIAEAPAEHWDISQKQDGSVLAWTHQNGDVKELYLAANGGINANCGERNAECNSGISFSSFFNVESIRFNGFFHTDQLTSLSDMFSGCQKLKKLDIGDWNTSAVRWTRSMFSNCASLEELDIHNWNTASLRRTNSMFYNCKNLKSLDLSGWKPAGLWEIDNMFNGCSSLTELDLSKWSTGSLESARNLFYGCSNLKTVKLENWNTSNVTNMAYMFKGCNALGDLDLSKWNTSKVTDYKDFMNEGKTINGRPWEEFFNPELRTAENTTAKNTTYSPDAWKNNMLMRNALDACEGLRKEEIQSVIVLDTIADAPAEHWDISQKQDGSVLAWTHQNGDVKELYLAADGGINAYWGSHYGQIDSGVSFQGFSNVERIRFNGFFHVDQLKDLSEMFSGCAKLKALDIEDWNTSSVTSMRSMFNGCTSLTEKDLSNWSTTSLETATGMFTGCTALTELDLSGWKTANLVFTDCMFAGCENLTTLGINTWNTSGLRDMSYMFNNCKRLTELDLSQWNTAALKDARGMFMGCSALKNVNIENWNTGNLRYAGQMFRDCESLTSLNIGKWNTSNVVDTNLMFGGCTNLQTLDLSKWNTGNVLIMSGMFQNCDSLTELNLDHWETKNVAFCDDFMDEGRKVAGEAWENLFLSSANIAVEGDSFNYQDYDNDADSGELPFFAYSKNSVHMFEGENLTITVVPHVRALFVNVVTVTINGLGVGDVDVSKLDTTIGYGGWRFKQGDGAELVGYTDDSVTLRFSHMDRKDAYGYIDYHELSRISASVVGRDVNINRIYALSNAG